MKSNLISISKFFIVWMLLHTLIGHFNYMHKPPMGVHQGAQCDRASLAQNYYYNGLNFIYPEINETFCQDGIVSVEMPLPSYLAAICYRIFGYNDAIFRWITFLLYTIGMYALWRLLRLYIGFLASACIMCILACSPIVLFYSVSFLPDIVSLGFILVSWYLFFRQFIPHLYWHPLNKKIYTVLFILSLTFGIAIKTTSAISLCAMLGVAILSLVRKTEISLLQRKKLFISLAIATIIPILWQIWSRHLGNTHRSEYFLMHIPLPNSWLELKNAITIYWNNWPQQTFSGGMYYLVLIASVLLLFFRKKITASLYYLSLLLSLGTLLFIVIMSKQFMYHDYYIICLLPTVIIHWITWASMFQNRSIGKWYIKIGFAVLLLFGAITQWKYGKQNFEERFTPGNYWEQSQQNTDDYTAFKNILNSKGINYHSFVAAGYDGAPNNMLYLLHLRGFRVEKDLDSARRIDIIKHCKPLIIIANDTGMLNEFKPIITHFEKIATYKYLNAYSVSY